MKRSTIIRLNALNQRFYHENAASFADSRQAPWSGWEQLKPFLNELMAQKPDKKLKILDVGCGDGRFGRWLIQQGYAIEYLGIDNSSALLRIGKDKTRENTSSTFKFAEHDVVNELLDDGLKVSGTFDVIVLFGVMHHVPSSGLRRQLVSQLGSLLTPHGALIFTLWQLQHHPQLLSRQASADVLGLSAEQLEPGDFILDWQRDGSGYRYCHDFSADQSSLFNQNNLKIIGSYNADGNENKSNKYIILSIF